MKKKIFIVFITLSICFTGGGFYIVRSIDWVTEKLETIITLHQVEILRKTLLNQVNRVQEDLLLIDTPHAVDIDSFVGHVEQMNATMDGCFACHHVEPTHKLLEELRTEIQNYQRALSGVYTLRGNRERLVASAGGTPDCKVGLFERSG